MGSGFTDKIFTATQKLPQFKFYQGTYTTTANYESVRESEQDQNFKTIHSPFCSVNFPELTFLDNQLSSPS